MGREYVSSPTLRLVVERQTFPSVRLGQTMFNLPDSSICRPMLNWSSTSECSQNQGMPSSPVMYAVSQTLASKSCAFGTENRRRAIQFELSERYWMILGRHAISVMNAIPPAIEYLFHARIYYKNTDPSIKQAILCRDGCMKKHGPSQSDARQTGNCFRMGFFQPCLQIP